MVVLSPQHGGNAAFFSNFPLAESITKEFCWLFLCNFKEKSINHFLWHSLSELFLTMPIYVCPPLASVSGDTGTSPHPFRGFCCWSMLMECWVGIPSASANEGGIGVIVIMERRVRIPSGRQGKLPSRGRAGCGNGLRTGNYGRPGKASTNSMVISGSASTN